MRPKDITTKKIIKKDEIGQIPEAEKIKENREIGGYNGLEPTRYGDWEKNGRCIDF